MSSWGAGHHGIAIQWFYGFGVGIAPLAFRERLSVAAHMAFVCVALALPIAYSHNPREAFVRFLCGRSLDAHRRARRRALRERLEAGQSALRDTAGRDPLTGVGNYRTLHDMLAYEIARHERFGRRFTLTATRPERLQAGERALRPPGGRPRAARGRKRAHDHAAGAGYGRAPGRRRVLDPLAPESGPVDARALAERIRRERARCAWTAPRSARASAVPSTPTMARPRRRCSPTPTPPSSRSSTRAAASLRTRPVWTTRRLSAERWGRSRSPPEYSRAR